MRKETFLAVVAGVIFLFSFCAFAQESGQVEARKLSLEESINIALENNLDFKMAKHNVNLREVEYKQAQANNLLQASILNLKNAEFSLKQAKNTLEETKRQVILDVMDAYFQVLKAKQEVEIEKMSVQEAEENLKIVRNKFSLGDASKKDLLEAEINLSLAEFNLKKAEHQLDIAKIGFNKVLGLPLDTEFELTDTFSVEPLNISLEKAVEEALKNRYEIKKAQNELELAKIKWELSQNDYTPELEKENAKINLENTRVNLEEVKRQIVQEIHRLFRGLEEKEENIKITEKTEKLKQEIYDIAQKQYEAGLISATELLDAQINLTQAQLDRIGALFEYNLAKAEFIKALAIDLNLSKKETQAPSEG
ncbi:TolC family protein [Candidatus Aerophobetes bacterium]|nr:TolC family protein [Candidatus Aerophobetes bacterium]